MKIFNIHEAKTHFSKLINQALAGEEIIIAKGGHPLVQLLPYLDQVTTRKSDQLKGMIIIEDNFDKPLPEHFMKNFYNNDDDKL